MEYELWAHKDLKSWARVQSRSKLQLKTYAFLCISNNLRLKELVSDTDINNIFAIYGGDVFKCNGLSSADILSDT